MRLSSLSLAPPLLFFFVHFHLFSSHSLTPFITLLRHLYLPLSCEFEFEEQRTKPEWIDRTTRVRQMDSSWLCSLWVSEKEPKRSWLNERSSKWSRPLLSSHTKQVPVRVGSGSRLVAEKGRGKEEDMAMESTNRPGKKKFLRRNKQRETFFSCVWVFLSWDLYFSSSFPSSCTIFLSVPFRFYFHFLQKNEPSKKPNQKQKHKQLDGWRVLNWRSEWRESIPESVLFWLLPYTQKALEKGAGMESTQLLVLFPFNPTNERNHIKKRKRKRNPTPKRIKKAKRKFFWNDNLFLFAFNWSRTWKIRKSLQKKVEKIRVEFETKFQTDFSGSKSEKNICYVKFNFEFFDLSFLFDCFVTQKNVLSTKYTIYGMNKNKRIRIE